MSKMNLTTWIEFFDRGDFENRSTEKQIACGWYDWFCRDESLFNKTRQLGPKVKRIAKSEKIDCDKTYVFFKNNCPLYGSLYDDFRICDINEDEVLYTIVPKSGHKINKNRSEVWGKENDFCEPLVEGTWKDVLSFFGV